MQKHNFTTEIKYQGEYLEYTPATIPNTIENEEDQRVYLFLHGYGENAEVFYKRTLKSFTPQHRSLFLNGIFPIPTIRQDIVLYQYAWYFYNPVENKYFIDFNAPVESIQKLLAQIIPSDKKLTIIGYSQGGYLAPFLAAALPNADHVIVINASIREDFLGNNLNFKLDQIHGEEDDRVDYQIARERFEKLKTRLPSSTWHSLPQQDHKLSDEILKALEKTLTFV